MTELEGLKVECPRKGASTFNLVNGSYLTAKPQIFISFLAWPFHEDQPLSLIEVKDVRNTHEANLWAKGYFEGTGITHWTVYERQA